MTGTSSTLEVDVPQGTISQPVFIPRLTANMLAETCSEASDAMRDRAYNRVLWARSFAVVATVLAGSTMGLSKVCNSMLWRVWRIKNPQYTQMAAIGAAFSAITSFVTFMSIVSPLIGLVPQITHYRLGAREYDLLYLKALTIDEHARNSQDLVIDKTTNTASYLPEHIVHRISEVAKEKTALDGTYLNATLYTLVYGTQ